MTTVMNFFSMKSLTNLRPLLLLASFQDQNQKLLRPEACHQLKGDTHNIQPSAWEPEQNMVVKSLYLSLVGSNERS